MSQELDDLKSQLAAANARIAEMTTMPGGESIADSWAVVDLWEDRDWVPIRPQCSDHLDALRVLARALTATRAELSESRRVNADIIDSGVQGKRDWCGVCKRGWSWVDGNAARNALSSAEALEKELAVVKRDLEIAFRVVDMHKAQATEAVRIGCDNITAREAAESSLAALTKQRDGLVYDVIGLRADLEAMTSERDGWRTKAQAKP